jgi:hypothetical protein
MGAHSITAKTSTIVPGGILALGLAVVLLAATASTASADRGLSPWYCPPLPTQTTTLDQIPEGCLGNSRVSYDFGYPQLGTSAQRRFALGVYNTDTLTPRISVSGNYAQTNNCPPTLSATGEQIAGCLITVTFTPTSTGANNGTLSTGTGGPTAALTGYGVTTPTRPPDLQLSGKKTQHEAIGARTDCGGKRFTPVCGACDRGACDIKVKASCGDEPCTASSEGKLTKVKNDKLVGTASADLAPGETTNVDLYLTKKTRKKAGKALDDGENVQAKVTVRAKGAAGHVATAKRTIRIRVDG